MDKKLKGAWLVHHARKVQATTNQDFDQINFAGKCGTLLSAISASSQGQLEITRVQALAKANSISPRSELPAVLQELKRQKLIEATDSHVEILGLTSSSILEHATTIFEEAEPTPVEEAVIDISERISESPMLNSSVQAIIEDEFRLSSAEANDLLSTSRSIGFFDSETLADKDLLLFNGNLFRRDDVQKANSVLSTLNAGEAALVKDFNKILEESGCVSLQHAHHVLSESLFKKLHSIGLFDVNAVGNEYGQNYFVTRPAAFSKFSNSIADDALDLAKAFVTSLTYGMTISGQGRGRIQMISALMRKLIAGHSVGPATAIGKDYQVLEMRGVVAVTPAGGSMFNMRLLKPEVGRLALAVITEGNLISETVMQSIPGAKVTEYKAPEENREVLRKNITAPLRAGVASILDDLRTGGLTR